MSERVHTHIHAYTSAHTYTPLPLPDIFLMVFKSRITLVHFNPENFKGISLNLKHTHMQLSLLDWKTELIYGLGVDCSLLRGSLICIAYPLVPSLFSTPNRLLTKGQNALVELQTQRPVALELYKDFKELGRFMLRYSGSTIAAGVVTEVPKPLTLSIVNLVYFTFPGDCGDLMA